MSEVLRIPNDVIVENWKFDRYSIEWQCAAVVVTGSEEAQSVVDLLAHNVEHEATIKEQAEEIERISKRMTLYRLERKKIRELLRPLTDTEHYYWRRNIVNEKT